MFRSGCCRFNHPCPIWCPCARRVCRNEVVNPVLTESFGFFNNTSVGVVAANAIIPLNLVELNGSGILPNGAGGVTLAGGTYQVSYFANGTVPAGGIMSVKLRLNGVDVPGSVISVTETAGNVASLTQTIVLTTQQGGTLELVNNSTATNFSLASMLIRRIGN